MLFDDEDRQAAARARTSPVAKARRSAAAERKARTKRNAMVEPVHSFQTLLGDLATVVKSRVRPDLGGHPKPATDGHLKTGHHE